MYPLLSIAHLSKFNHQEIIRIRGRIFSKKDCGRVLFLIVRDGINTLQAIVLKSKDSGNQGVSKPVYEALRKVENESFVELIGTVCLAQKVVIACSQKDIELEVMDFALLSRSVLELPITLKETTLKESQKQANGSLPSVQFFKRLDNRVLDLRTELSQAIFRLNDGLLFYIQKYIRKHDFLEIKTPKLIGGSSEGGANVFELDYFGRQACLAQSPQLYKQMAIIGDFKRVFEIGPVFRAENSNTHRHLTEFVGIDFEMVIDRSFMEVVYFVYQLLTYVFDKLFRKYRRELDIVHASYNIPKLLLSPELVMIRFSEAVDLLKAHFGHRADLEDFSTEEEKILGEIIREKYQTDLYVITHYPTSVRPFYTMVDPQDSRYTCSYDVMLRGGEILSGAQRINHYEALCENLKVFGIDKVSIAYYLEAFKYGAPPHAGGGMGLERLLKYFLDLPDIRYCNIFPRDPKRLYP